MGRLVRGVAAVVGLGVGLGVLAMGPAGDARGAMMAESDDGVESLIIDGGLHEAEPTDRQIVEARVVEASPGVCWDMWTTSEGVGSFLTENNKVELRIGGPYEVYFAMQLPEGQRGSEGCKILSYLPQRMLSFEWNAPPTFPEIRGKHTRVVVMFEEVDGGTRVELTHLGFGSSEQWGRVHEYFTKAWPRVMDSFAESVQS